MVDSTSSPQADLLQVKKRSLAGWPMILGWLAMIIFALHASTHMVGAGDTWVALACGRHFYNHGVDTKEPFSANSHRVGPTAEEIASWPQWAQKLTEKVGIDTVKYWHPTGWVNQNWLTHVIFHWLAYESPFADGPSLSFNTLMYWKFAVYILTVICIYCSGRIMGAHPALSAAAACASMFIGRSFIDIRPAGFSNLMVAVFLLILILSTYRNRLYIWLLVPATVFWANLHGGYIYIFIMLTPILLLRTLTLLPRRATVCFYSVLAWFALFAIMKKTTGQEPFSLVAPVFAQNKLLMLLVLLTVISIVMTVTKSTQAILFYGYHIGISFIVFIAIFAQFFPDDMPQISPEAKEIVLVGRLTFFGMFIAAIATGLVITFLKDRFRATSPAAVCHLAGAGLAAFIASIIFNPFHLTNLTHTFQISISANAEGWRNVHEWWPAFRWDNPVGSGFPFMVMMIAFIGLFVIWILSRFLVPKAVRLVKPQTMLLNDQRQGTLLAKIIGFLAAVLIVWAIMISFSLADTGPTAVNQVKADGIENTLQSFVFAGLFVGILWLSIFVNVHFIYLILPFTLVALYTARYLPGYVGRYNFPFVTVPFYCGLFAVISKLSKKPKYSMLNVVYVLAASVATIVISVVTINPFKFTRPVWHLGQFVNLRRVWTPLFEANLEITYPYLFQIIYLINFVCIICWLAAPYIKEILSDSFAEKADWAIPAENEYKKPNIDLALVVIAALTVYMAIRSRRFIPISGYVTCPLIALLADQIIQMAAASRYFRKTGRLSLPRMPMGIKRLLTASCAAVVIGLGTWWSIKFYNVYIAPWPTETKLTSAFIRMTASGAKPFEACRFITDNKMRGNMFNYWTEGGFIAWGQIPDPDGHTPLQLFMDGRAQAAYNYNAYQNWQEIMSGGPVSQRIILRGKNFTPEDFLKVGEWLDERLKRHKVWVVLMPSNQFDTPFVKGLEHNANWRMVYLDDKQKLYVDISTQRGKEIFEGIETGQTAYPEPSYRNIMIAHNSLLFDVTPERLAKGLEAAIMAFEANPTRTPAQLVQIFYDRYPELRPGLNAFWQKHLDDFLANKKKYLHSNGYYFRAIAALMAMGHMQPAAQGAKIEQFQKERIEIERAIETMQDKRW